MADPNHDPAYPSGVTVEKRWKRLTKAFNRAHKGRATRVKHTSVRKRISGILKRAAELRGTTKTGYRQEPSEVEQAAMNLLDLRVESECACVLQA
jgi:hypothetical protein